MLRTFIAALSCGLALGAPDQFEVKSLPGWDGPLLSRAWCGFSHAGVPPSGEGNMFFNCESAAPASAAHCIPRSIDLPPAPPH